VVLVKNSYLRGNIAVLAVSSAFTNLGAGIIGLFLPEYFRLIGGNTIVLGIMTSVQFFTLPLGGFIADRYGRKKILVLAGFYGVIFPLFYAVVQDWRLFASIGAFAALGSISIPAYHTTVADSSREESHWNIDSPSSFFHAVDFCSACLGLDDGQPRMD